MTGAPVDRSAAGGRTVDGPTATPRPGWAGQRVDRLRDAAARIHRAAPGFTGRTAADPTTGETWDRGQLLSHVVEMLPYWSSEVHRIVAAGGGGLPFGRVKSTPSRLLRIESRRQEATDVLLAAMDAEVTQLTDLLHRLTDEQRALTGTHQTKGVMTVAQLIDEFLVDHLAEHAAQLAG